MYIIAIIGSMRRVDEEAERDGGIEVPGDAHRRRHHHGEDQPVRDRHDDERIRIARHRRRHDRRAPDEHEGEDADELGGEVAPAVAHGAGGSEVKVGLAVRVKANGAALARVRARYTPSCRLSTTAALMPPNPKLLLSAYSTSASRPSRGM